MCVYCCFWLAAKELFWKQMVAEVAWSGYVGGYNAGSSRFPGIDYIYLCVRVRPPALILEEIAIDCHNKETEERLLQEAHDLHLSSLQLAKKAFGEFNVQTAKHYGNLGRLYQSMRKFKVGPPPGNRRYLLLPWHPVSPCPINSAVCLRQAWLLCGVIRGAECTEFMPVTFESTWCPPPPSLPPPWPITLNISHIASCFALDRRLI